MTVGIRSVETVIHTLKPRVLEVRSNERITPRMARITLTGDDLEGFATSSPTDHIKLVSPKPDQEQPVMPAVGQRGLQPAGEGQEMPTIRDYTVRAYRPEVKELVVDFVLHGAGPAVIWAENAGPGRRIGVLGPRGSHVVPADFDWYVLAGDETALPSIGRWIEEARSEAQVIAFVEINDPAEEQEIRSSAKVDARWLHRNGQEPGTTTLLETAIREFEFPAGDGFVWMAGEAGTLKTIRRYMLRELELRREWVDVDGYWKRGVVNLDHHAPIDDDE